MVEDDRTHHADVMEAIFHPYMPTQQKIVF